MYSELLQKVTALAKVAAKNRAAAGLNMQSAKVSVEYGVTLDTSVSGSGQISLVAVSGTGDFNRNNTQSVTLFFGKDAPTTK